MIRSMLAAAPTRVPAAAAPITWAEMSTTLPAAYTPGTVVWPISSTTTWTPCPGVRHGLRAERGEDLAPGHHPRRDGERLGRDQAAVPEPDPGDRVVLDLDRAAVPSTTGMPAAASIGRDSSSSSSVR